VNSIAGASVHATLPSYVRYVQGDAAITYDPVTHGVTWAAGEVPAGSAYGAPKTAAFQVALLPSTSQRGTSPVLMSSISYTGTDRFTKLSVEGMASEVSTQTIQDVGFQGIQGEVVR
jgi:hypothetical protein